MMRIRLDAGRAEAGAVAERMRRTRSKTRPLGWLVVAAAVALSASAAGCEYLGQFFAWGFAPRHPKKQVKAEYHLEADHLVIVPYAGTSILFEYPTASVQVAGDVRYEIARRLEGRVKQIVDPAYVVRWQESHLEWPNMTLEAIAKTFQADTLLYVELERYTMFEPGSPNLLRGQVRARIQIVKAGAQANPVYETTVETVFPEERPVAQGELSLRRLRATTTRLFARDVVRLFYDHEVPLRGEEIR